jgi:TRAP transporter TAXI family solute receptor
MLRPLRLAAAALALVLPVCAAPAAEPRVVGLATGDPNGVYHPVGLAICRLVNEHRREHGVRCAAEPSEGAVANVLALGLQRTDFALIQSDVQAEAWEGRLPGGPFSALRSLFSLYPEPLTIVARANTGIASIDDLPGHRVGLGALGAGGRVLVERYAAERGWDDAAFTGIEHADDVAENAALCAGGIDAFLRTLGHPSATILEATAGCETRIAEADGSAVEALLDRHPYYFAATVPGGLYPGTPEDVPTFGVAATLVTREDVPEDLVYLLVRAVFEDFETFRGLDPVLAGLDPRAMASTGATAPMHPGAERYFRERGWLD